ncbi:hypothetical protein NS258_03590 [Sphingomonas sanguinis]|uniref:Uncharacterized protein n=1 Tax=Sphingomonas sanguinis TaxID=33051 RepID=A0A147JBN4_9SPHN|nr:hypothetical protein NS258_03590 [Sphingomonas sanguinis]
MVDSRLRRNVFAVIFHSNAQVSTDAIEHAVRADQFFSRVHGHHGRLGNFADRSKGRGDRKPHLLAGFEQGR